MQINKKSVVKLNNKKLSTLVNNYDFDLSIFISDDGYEMTIEQYELLKNHKVKIELLNNDPNFDFGIEIDNYYAYCIFDNN